MRLQVIGGGKMGEALLGGLITQGWAPADELAVVEPVAARRDELRAAHPGVDVRDDPLRGVDAVVAVKPDTVEHVCEVLAERGVRRALSIAAGIPIARLERWLAPATAVVRAMPNTPALVGVGAAAIAAGSAATDADVEWAASILRAVGTVHVVDESLLDAVTGLSGSGPAYVFLLAEALIDAGVAAGLPRDLSAALTEQTLLGAATLLARTGTPPEVLRANVTSPGGTTAAGLKVFEDAGFRALVTDVVLAATRRSRELGAA
ncbi:MAG TPA: pyrroline-5-carboxylate reductase [Acidimicrobiales bacterium]